jgi:hypothetical protein
LLDLYEAQVGIGQNIVDFAVEKYKIAIECDHILLDYKRPDEKKSDLRKTKFLVDNGWTVFRFTAPAILTGAIVCHRMIADEIMKYESKIMDVNDFLSEDDTDFLKINFSEIEIITSGTFEKETKKFDRRK